MRPARVRRKRGQKDFTTRSRKRNKTKSYQHKSGGINLLRVRISFGLFQRGGGGMAGLNVVTEGEDH